MLNFNLERQFCRITQLCGHVQIWALTRGYIRILNQLNAKRDTLYCSCLGLAGTDAAMHPAQMSNPFRWTIVRNL